MVNGHTPWHYLDNEWAVMYQIAVNGIEELPTVDQVGVDGVDFLHNCFAQNPKDRPKVTALLEHPFFTNLSEDDFDETTQFVLDSFHVNELRL